MIQQYVDMMTPEQELKLIMAKVSTEKLEAVDQRVVSGNLEGRLYIGEECGCLYGSLFIEDHPEQDFAALNEAASFQVDSLEHQPYRQVVEDVIEFRDKLLGYSLHGKTHLEDKVWGIHKGDTPERNPTSAWLHEMLVAEIERRKGAQ